MDACLGGTNVDIPANLESQKKDYTDFSSFAIHLCVKYSENHIQHISSVTSYHLLVIRGRILTQTDSQINES